MQNDRETHIKMISMICNRPSLKPKKGKRARMINAWMVDTIVPLNAFPMTIENLDTGATRISFMKPNSLSHIMDIEENIELKRMVMPIIPGEDELGVWHACLIWYKPGYACANNE